MRLPKEFLNDPVKLAVRAAYQKIAAQGRIPTDEEINAELSPELANDRRRCSEIIQAAQAQIEAKRPRAPDHGSMEWVHRTYAKIQAIRERPLRMGSMFSGIGAPEEACRQLRLKVELIWYAEIEAAQSAVMAHHHPDAVNLGDITRHDFIDMATARGPIDLVFGGPPCQAFSSAGNKGGLDDPRGALSLTYCDHLDAISPKLAFLENVKEILGNETNPMGHILPRLAGEQDIVLAPPNGKRWPNAGVVEGPRRVVAWRLFDAVHWGPEKQRRERIYMIAAERSSGIDPTTILFD